ncbi:hypothetical protein GE21DRAFT_1275918 [Neurospora crassa]|nr:hypothetical protein GE21DRAFT_1275918 [Neurospora crassa]
MVIESSRTCYKCHQSFDTDLIARRHIRKYRPHHAARAESISIKANQPHQRTCGHCHKVNESRNALFRHLKGCAAAAEGKIEGSSKEPLEHSEAPTVEEEAPPTDEALFIDGAFDYKLKEAPKETTEAVNKNPLSSFTHLRIAVRPNLERNTNIDEVYIDNGAARTIIGRPFLEQLEHTIKERNGCLSGIEGGKYETKDWATFTFYLPGEDKDGEPTLIKFTKSGWVVDKLKPNMLLGNDFAQPHELVIDNGTRRIKFPKLDGFNIAFSARNNANACKRRVTATRKVVLMPGQEAFVPVEYTPLPKDRSFSFIAKHNTAVHAIIDAKTPQVVKVVNLSDGPLTINKYSKVGDIHETLDTGYFTTTWTKALKTITISTALTALGSITSVQAAVAAGSTAVDPISITTLTSIATIPNASLDLNNIVRAIANGTIEDRAPARSPAHKKREEDDPKLSTPAEPPPGTPLSDSIFNMIEQSKNVFDVPVQPGNAATEEQTTRPRVPEKQSTLGIRMPTDVPEIVTDEGIHICATNPGIVEKITRLVKKFPKL